MIHTRIQSSTPLPVGDQSEAPKRPAVLVQKRQPKPVSNTREKLCATCGKPFPLDPDQKFFDCPDCYRRNYPARRPGRKDVTQVLTQIQCIECGAKDFLDFLPADPERAYCRACFSRRKREHKEP